MPQTAKNRGTDAASVARRYKGRIVEVWTPIGHVGHFYAAPRTLYRLDEFYRPMQKFGDVRMYEGGRLGPIVRVEEAVIRARDVFGDKPGKTDDDAVNWAMTNLAEGILAKRWEHDYTLDPWIRDAYKRMRGERFKEASYQSRSDKGHIESTVRSFIESVRAGRVKDGKGFLTVLGRMGMIPSATKTDREELELDLLNQDEQAILARIRRLTGGRVARDVQRRPGAIYTPPRERIPADAPDNMAGRRVAARRGRR